MLNEVLRTNKKIKEKIAGEHLEFVNEELRKERANLEELKEEWMGERKMYLLRIGKLIEKEKELSEAKAEAQVRNKELSEMVSLQQMEFRWEQRAEELTEDRMELEKRVSSFAENALRLPKDCDWMNELGWKEEGWAELEGRLTMDHFGMTKLVEKFEANLQSARNTCRWEDVILTRDKVHLCVKILKLLDSCANELKTIWSLDVELQRAKESC